MSSHDDLIEKYQKSGKTVTVGLASLGLFKATIAKFDPADDQVVLEAKDGDYAGRSFACHKANLFFLTKST